MRNRAKIVIIGLLSALGLVAVGAGIAYAAIPDSGGVIHGCYKTSGPAQGAVTVIDTDLGQTCPSGSASLNWEQAAGARVTIATVQRVINFGSATGTVVSDAAFCPSGYNAVGGGFRASLSTVDAGAGELQERWVVLDNSPSGPTGWEVALEETGSPYVGGSSSWQLTTYAKCLPTSA